MINLYDTICAPATSVGSGAISIVRISGPQTFDVLDKVVKFGNGNASSSKGYTLKRGVVHSVPNSSNAEKVNFSLGEEIDDVLVAFFHAPHSYTGEDSAEIYCHASSYIVGQILAALSSQGCRLALAGEFTRRAFINGKMDLAQAEAVADVISSTSEAQHRVAANQLKGGYSREIASVRAQLLELTSLMELELDFSEEDVEFADRSRLRALLEETIDRCSKLASSFKLGNAVKNGVPVAIIGAPNSGKSTLLNALLEDDRAIVSEIPGTTRDTVEETFVLGGILYRFIDTAGIRESQDLIEKLGIERTFKKIAQADIVLGLVDTTSDSAANEISELLSRVDLNSQILLLIFNKIDKLSDVSESRLFSIFNDFERFYPYNIFVRTDNKSVLLNNNEELSFDYLSISAKTGFGLDELRSKLISLTNLDNSGDVLVTNARHFEALKSAVSSLIEVRNGIDADSPLSTELLAEDLRSALNFLGSITGEITTDEVLGEVFSRFCIGK